MTGTSKHVHERPSRLIFFRLDPEQVWRECESAHEIGYAGAEADIQAGLPQMSSSEQNEVWGFRSEYAHGYRNGYWDHEMIKRFRNNS